MSRMPSTLTHPCSFTIHLAVACQAAALGSVVQSTHFGTKALGFSILTLQRGGR